MLLDIRPQPGWILSRKANNANLGWQDLFESWEISYGIFKSL